MVDIFVEHTPPALTEMGAALARAEYPAVAKLAHQIKPSIKSMGIHQLDGIALDIETSAKAEAVDAELLAAKVNLLHETLLRVIDRIRRDREMGEHNN